MLAVRKNRYVILAKDFEEGAWQHPCFVFRFAPSALPPRPCSRVPTPTPLTHSLGFALLCAAYKSVINKDDDEHSFYK